MKRFLFLILFLFLIVNCFASVDVIIDSKETFRVNDEISFGYFFYTYEDVNITYVPGVICDNNLQSSLTIYNLSLKKGEVTHVNYSYGFVDETINDDSCRAVVTIFEPSFEEFTRGFQIVSLDDLFVSINACKTQECDSFEREFFIGDTIFIDTVSNVEDITQSLFLTLPSSEIKPLNGPVEFILDELGTYQITVRASKDGYKSFEKTITFIVIDSNNFIGTRDFDSSLLDSPPDTKVDRSSESNLPFDEVSPESSSSNGYYFVIILFFVVIVILLFYIVRLIKLHKKNKVNI